MIFWFSPKRKHFLRFWEGQLQIKINKKLIQKSCKIWSASWSNSKWILEANLVPRSSQNPAKIEENRWKMDFQINENFVCFLKALLVALGSQHGRKSFPKGWPGGMPLCSPFRAWKALRGVLGPRPSKINKNNKSFNLFVNPLALWRAVGAALDTSKINQNSIKNHWKIIQKSIKNLSKSIKNQPKIYQNQFLGPKRPQDSPKTFPSPKTGGISPPLSSPPRAPFGRLFRPCWPPRATKRAFKKHTKFSLIWKSLSHRFSSILAGFWEDLGPKLASKIH